MLRTYILMTTVYAIVTCFFFLFISCAVSFLPPVDLLFTSSVADLCCCRLRPRNMYLSIQYGRRFSVRNMEVLDGIIIVSQPKERTTQTQILRISSVKFSVTLVEYVVRHTGRVTILIISMVYAVQQCCLRTASFLRCFGGGSRGSVCFRVSVQLK